ncbi:TerD family protein [Sandarakinorhabdus sp.]|uniref:TerD family protein n=1 Tax=Sandarakinorhabdus sp. TaxID=1916663 RepID=UPI003F6FAC30
MVSLSKGQGISLTKANPGLSMVAMGLGWDVAKKRGFFGGWKDGDDVDLDASCLLFDAGGNLVDQVWFRQLTSRDGSVLHTGDNRTGAGDGDDEVINVKLNDVPGNVQTLVFTVNSFTGINFTKIENAFCRVVNMANDQELARFDLSNAGPHTAQVMAKLVRKDGGWDFVAIGTTGRGRTFHDLVPVIVPSL